MFIIAGLGNPGREFENTRHNIGFRVLDYIGLKYNISINRSKFKGLCGEGTLDGEKVLLLKPQTYMNSSGESILDAVQYYKMDCSHLIVIYDDMNIPLGRIRMRPSGSDGGHNGMKSIIYLLESDEFPRLRVGIGSPKYNMVEHVLGKFDAAEQAVVEDMVKVSADAVHAIVKQDIQYSMNKYNSYRHESLDRNSED